MKIAENNITHSSHFLVHFLMKAQELLTPENAVALAISKNFDIVLAKNEADIAKINNNKATAGMLPSINVTSRRCVST
jgi:outer membrane protein TolC